MVDYKLCSLGDIIEDAKDNGRVDYLKTLAAKTYKKEDGKKRKISFFEIKQSYYEKYYKSLLPVAKSKKKSMYDIIDEL